MKKTITLIAVLPLLAGCAGSGANYEPILDGAPSETYSSDLSECQALARSQSRFNQERLAATALGAGIGAALGEAENGDAMGGAVAGALAGGAASTVDINERRESIVLECMRGRGHRVVG